MGRWARNGWGRDRSELGSRWAPYVPVATRRRRAERKAKQMAKKGKKLSPVAEVSRNIADTFWGRAWCDNLESYGDFANRLPRGRTYVRNGSVIDLQIGNGTISALVSGSDVYEIAIKIVPLDTKTWTALCRQCAASVSSLLDLLRGKLPPDVLKRLTDPKGGLFPKPQEMKFRCSCPDYATMCKHVAATLYGVGARLDQSPELFFKMRGVDQSELVAKAFRNQSSNDVIGLNQAGSLDAQELESVFGIELASAESRPSGNGRVKSNKANTTKRTPRRSTREIQTTQSPITNASALSPKQQTGRVRSRKSTAALAASRPTRRASVPAQTPARKVKIKPPAKRAPRRKLTAR